MGVIVMSRGLWVPMIYVNHIYEFHVMVPVSTPKGGVVYVLPKLSSEQFNSVRAYFVSFWKDQG
jgi:hypothetical protein